MARVEEYTFRHPAILKPAQDEQQLEELVRLSLAACAAYERVRLLASPKVHLVAACLYDQVTNSAKVRSPGWETKLATEAAHFSREARREFGVE